MEHIDFSKLQTQINEEEKSSGEEFDQRCFMVQGNDSLEVYSDTQLDDSISVGPRLQSPDLVCFDDYKTY